MAHASLTCHNTSDLLSVLSLNKTCSYKSSVYLIEFSSHNRYRSSSFHAFPLFPLFDRRYLSSDGLCVRLSDFQHPWRHCLSVCRPRFVRSSSMAVSQQKALAMAGLCTLLVLTFLDVNAACSLAQLTHCAAVVSQGSLPTPACCTEVDAITDFNCFCEILLKQSNLQKNIIDNALNVPKNCGTKGNKLRNRYCGKYTIP